MPVVELPPVYRADQTYPTTLTFCREYELRHHLISKRVTVEIRYIVCRHANAREHTSLFSLDRSEELTISSTPNFCHTHVELKDTRPSIAHLFPFTSHLAEVLITRSDQLSNLSPNLPTRITILSPPIVDAHHAHCSSPPLFWRDLRAHQVPIRLT